MNMEKKYLVFSNAYNVYTAPGNPYLKDLDTAIETAKRKVAAGSGNQIIIELVKVVEKETPPVVVRDFKP